eukprot:10359-Heterococcus_DN1.PRE.1
MHEHVIVTVIPLWLQKSSALTNDSHSYSCLSNELLYLKANLILNAHQLLFGQCTGRIDVPVPLCCCCSRR